MVLRVPALAAALVVAAVTCPASAERSAPVPGRVSVAARVVQEAAAAALTGHVDEALMSEPVALPATSTSLGSETLAVARVEPAPSKGGSSGVVLKRCGLGSGCGYKALLSYLVITHDLEIPGAPGMALRLIPTKSALAGEAKSPIVFKPRVVGTSWYGLDVAARF